MKYLLLPPIWGVTLVRVFFFFFKKKKFILAQNRTANDEFFLF
jgi:hypothetical protein